MSNGSATGRIISISNGKSYFCVLQCNQGDINQFYDDAGGVSPSFGSNNSPVLDFLAYDSENVGTPTEVGDGDITWTANGVVLSFSGGVSTTKFGSETGHFVKATKNVTYNDGTPNKVTVKIQQLKVVKNLLGINEKSSFAIGAAAVKSIGNTSAQLSATFPVTVAKGEITSRKVRIQSPESFSGAPFTISKKYGKGSSGSLVDGCYCKLEAVVITTSVETSGYTYEWAKMDASGWTAVTADAGTGNVLTVTEDMVDGSALFRCIVKKDGVYYGQDIQNVNDVSDPYQVEPNCVDEKGKPAAGVSYRGDGVPVIYQPYVRTGDTKVADSRVKFKMKLFDSIGTQLNDSMVTYGEDVKPPFLDNEAKAGGSTFSIPEKFITDNAGIDWQIDADIADK